MVKEPEIVVLPLPEEEPDIVVLPPPVPVPVPVEPLSSVAIQPTWKPSGAATTGADTSTSGQRQLGVYNKFPQSILCMYYVYYWWLSLRQLHAV